MRILYYIPGNGSLADVLGVDEMQVIHLALHELATKFLPHIMSQMTEL